MFSEPTGYRLLRAEEGVAPSISGLLDQPSGADDQSAIVIS
jgi:hypothetical protein